MINKLNINNQLSVDDALNILHQSNCGFSYYTVPSRYVLERKDLVKLISHAYCEGYDYRESVLQNRIITIQSILSKEDVVRNMLEIAFYLAQCDKDANEIDIKVKI